MKQACPSLLPENSGHTLLHCFVSRKPLYARMQALTITPLTSQMRKQMLTGVRRDAFGKK